VRFPRYAQHPYVNGEAQAVDTDRLDHLQRILAVIRVQIFATDIDEHALERARLGLYPESIAANVPPLYLETFFTREPHAYWINKEPREAVVFSVQNLISDLPCSKLDLISCRNILIYLQLRSTRSKRRQGSKRRDCTITRRLSASSQTTARRHLMFLNSTVHAAHDRLH
jgi:hypothetical protein